MFGWKSPVMFGFVSVNCNYIWVYFYFLLPCIVQPNWQYLFQSANLYIHSISALYRYDCMHLILLNLILIPDCFKGITKTNWKGVCFFISMDPNGCIDGGYIILILCQIFLLINHFQLLLYNYRLHKTRMIKLNFVGSFEEPGKIKWKKQTQINVEYSIN